MVEKRYASGSDFENPFYIIVHAHFIPNKITEELDEDLGSRLMDELSEIMDSGPGNWVEGSSSRVPEGVPRDRPILICGAYKEVSISEQHRRLVEDGYTDLYISNEGVLSLSDLKVD